MLKTICDDLTTCCGETPVLDFTELGDVPHSYVGEGGKVVRVNAGETGLEFFTLTLVTTFLGLSDTPGTYAGSGLFFVRVNAGETALEFFDLTSVLVTTFLELTDTPASYAGAALQVVRVNAGETALEFFTEVFTALGDVPTSYSGAANKVVVVNPSANGLTFSDVTVTNIGDDVMIPKRFISIIKPTVGATGAIQLIGAGTLSSSGTVSVQALATTNLITSTICARVASAAGVGSIASSRIATLIIWRGNAAGLGGFKFKTRVGTQTTVAQQRAFWGIWNATTDIGNVQPSTLTNIFGFGYDSAETVLSFLCNDNAGAATKTSLGANFPVDNSTLYDIVISCQPNASSIEYTITNLVNGSSATASISSNIPQNSVFLTMDNWVNSGTTNASVQLVYSIMEMDLIA